MKCPGQDSRYWKPDAASEVKCPECGNTEEFFKDEPTRRCKRCGKKIINPNMDFGCATYCKFREQCLGELPIEILVERNELLKDRVAVEMKHYFKRDFKRIGHATKVARYAEQIVREEDGDMAVVLIAAYLHDIGIKEAERKYQGDYARYHEEEGTIVAHDILTRLGANTDLIDEVCDVIGHHHHPRPEETINFKVVYDADLIVNLEEKEKKNHNNPEKIVQMIEGNFLTETGYKLARSVLLNITTE